MSFSLFFQTGCNSYGENNLNQSNHSSTCDTDEADDEGNCQNTKAYNLEILVKQSEIRVPKTSTAVDIGGECFAAGFSMAIILWQMKDASDTVVSQSGSDIATCDSLGRFRVRADVPTGTDLLVHHHTVTVTLLGVEEDSGRQVTNPTGINSRTVDIFGE